SFSDVPLPLGAHALRDLDLVVGDTGGHHRPHHRVGADGEVHDHRPVVDLHRLGDGRVDVLVPFAAQPHAAVCLCELDEVGHPGGAVTGVQVGIGVALVVEEVLPLPDHAQRTVVDDRVLDRDVVYDAGRELLIGHLEAPVAVDAPHCPVRLPDLGSHRRRNRVPHGAQATGVDPGAGVLVLDE